MKVSGFSFLRNGTLLGYPFIQIIQSVLPICDGFVVAVGAEQIKSMTYSPERRRLLAAMADMVRLDSQWLWGYHPTEYYLNNPWMSNTKRHGISQKFLKYFKLDPQQRRELQQHINQPKLLPLLLLAGLLVLLIGPAVLSYRRRQQQTL